MGCQRPLESLAAFAIVLAIGIVSTVGFTRYIDKLKQRASQADQAN